MEPQPEPDQVLINLEKDYQSVHACLINIECRHTPTQITQLIFRSLMLIEEELMRSPSSELLKMRSLFTNAMQMFHEKWGNSGPTGIIFKKSSKKKLKARRTSLKGLNNLSRKFGFNPAPQKLILLFDFIQQLGRIHFDYKTFELMFFGNKRLGKKEIYDGPGYELVRIFYKLKLKNIIVEKDYIQAICSNFRDKKGLLFNRASLNSMTGVILPNGGEEKLDKIIELLQAA